MDTIETEAPVGSDGATSSPDTALPVDTQSADSQTPVSDGEGGSPAEGATETLLAGKYKDPKELETAYKNLESKLGELGPKASIADMLQEKYGITPEQLRKQVEMQEAQALRERYANNPLAPLADEVQALKAVVQRQEQEKALMETKNELEAFIKENPAYEPHKDKIMKLALTPGIGFNPETGEETPFSDLASEWVGEIRAQGQQDAYKKIEVKKQTQATGVSSAAKKQFSPDDLRNMSVAELEAILPHRTDY